jgi:hypothetical protein
MLLSQQTGAGDLTGVNGIDAFAVRDATYTAGSNDLVGNGGVYISLSSTANLLVLDKLGWGTQPSGGYEGTAIANLATGQSARRKTEGALRTDTDVNSTDFNAPDANFTPKGSVSATEP